METNYYIIAVMVLTIVVGLGFGYYTHKKERARLKKVSEETTQATCENTTPGTTLRVVEWLKATNRIERADCGNYSMDAMVYDSATMIISTWIHDMEARIKMAMGPKIANVANINYVSRVFLVAYMRGYGVTVVPRIDHYCPKWLRNAVALAFVEAAESRDKNSSSADFIEDWFISLQNTLGYDKLDLEKETFFELKLLRSVDFLFESHLWNVEEEERRKASVQYARQVKNRLCAPHNRQPRDNDFDVFTLLFLSTWMHDSYVNDIVYDMTSLEELVVADKIWTEQADEIYSASLIPSENSTEVRDYQNTFVDQETAMELAKEEELAEVKESAPIREATECYTATAREPDPTPVSTPDYGNDSSTDSYCD